MRTWYGGFALYRRHLVCIQVRGTSIRVPSESEQVVARKARQEAAYPPSLLGGSRQYCPLAAHQSFAIVNHGRARKNIAPYKLLLYNCKFEREVVCQITLGPRALAWRRNPLHRADQIRTQAQAGTL